MPWALFGSSTSTVFAPSPCSVCSASLVRASVSGSAPPSAKKPRGKPIRITLTEDQIADIIQSAARTRRSLGAQNLEDRIAPSAIGAPLLDPGLTGGDAPPLPPGPDAGLPPDPFAGGELINDPYYVDPNAPPPGYVDPFAPPPGEVPLPGSPGSGGDVGTPPLPPLPPLPDAPDDGGAGGPILPPGVSEDPIYTPGTQGPGFVPPPVPDPTNPEGVPFFGHGDQLPPVPPLPPVGGDPNGPVLPPSPNDGFVPPPAPPADEGALPSSQELEEHRRNLLRQLRG
jgi:hypothetical protein